MQSRKPSINRRQSCGISVPPLMYCYIREGGNRHKGLRKNWNTRTIFQVYSYVWVQCSLVNLSRASTQVLSLSLHCYYRGWFLLIITFHWLQHTDSLHCWYCCLEVLFQISTHRTDYHPLKDVRTIVRTWILQNKWQLNAPPFPTQPHIAVVNFQSFVLK